jgi:hypothetical protein
MEHRLPSRIDKSRGAPIVWLGLLKYLCIEPIGRFVRLIRRPSAGVKQKLGDEQRILILADQRLNLPDV